MSNEMKREFLIPQSLENTINDNLKSYGLSLSDSKKIAAAIQWQSDFYIQNPNQATPWKEKNAQIAQWTYYLPLNFLRNLSVIYELRKQVPLSEFEGAFDYGAGLGAASWALRESDFQSPIFLYDKNSIPETALVAVNGQATSRIDFKSHQRHLGFFSYSLTEIPNRNDLLSHFPYLVIIEPSTQSEGRKLSETRDFLIKNDYHILAPCTHQKSCPLLTQSQRDWCHDRIFFKKPTWMHNIEKNLPFRNDSLTLSYLIAFKKASCRPEWLSSKPANQAAIGRLTGDLLPEKGKDKQLVCFDERRLFLTWLHKLKIDQTLHRGGLVEIPADIEVVANELRMKKQIQYLP